MGKVWSCPSSAPAVHTLNRDAWSAHLIQHSRVNVAELLQHAPTELQSIENQREYATVLVAWLSFKGALPPPLPLPLTHRQYKRAKAKEKKLPAQRF